MKERTKALPEFANEQEERLFWEKHDSSEYVDWRRARLAVLPNLKPTILFADSETTSFDDYEKAVMPYCGHRACGWAVLADDDDTAFYVPIRHRSPGARNFDVEPVMKWFQGLVDHADRWVNHVVKFDAHVATVDGVEIGDTELVCTNALAKTVDSDRYNHQLKPLCRDWVGLDME